MLENIGFDTAENEPCEVRLMPRLRFVGSFVNLGDLYTESGQTLQGSFSVLGAVRIPDKSSKTDGTGSSLPDLDKITVLGCIEAKFCK